MILDINITTQFNNVILFIYNIFENLILKLNNITIGNTSILKIFLGLIIMKMIITIFMGDRFGANQTIERSKK